MPVLIPLAILSASYVRYLIEAFKERSYTKGDLAIFRAINITIGVVCLIIPILVIFALKGNNKPHPLLFSLIHLFFWGLAVLFYFSLRMKRPLMLWSGMVGVTLAVCLALMPLASKLIITNPSYHNYKELKDRNDLQDVPFYFNGEIPGKFIEAIWHSGHEIKFWDPWKSPQLPTKLPILFLCHDDPTTVLPADILSNHEIQVIGHFDGNPGKKGGNIVLSNYVTLIK